MRPNWPFFSEPESELPDYHRRLFQSYVLSTRAALRAAESLRTGNIMPV
jgi:hypothetical protein